MGEVIDSGTEPGRREWRSSSSARAVNGAVAPQPRLRVRALPRGESSPLTLQRIAESHVHSHKVRRMQIRNHRRLLRREAGAAQSPNASFMHRDE